jgi:hypothetical protein
VGVSSRVDKLVDFFAYHIKTIGLVVVEPISMGHTCRNNRDGFEGVSNILEKFFSI